MAELKRDWTLNQGAFGRLLEWLDEGEDSKGERYLEVRRRLRLYFDRKNCLSPDDLTDETLNRIARKLEEKGSTTDVSALHYCYIVAKYVFLENLRQIESGTDRCGGRRTPAYGTAAARENGERRRSPRKDARLSREVPGRTPQRRPRTDPRVLPWRGGRRVRSWSAGRTRLAPSHRTC